MSELHLYHVTTCRHIERERRTVPMPGVWVVRAKSIEWAADLVHTAVLAMQEYEPGLEVELECRPAQVERAVGHSPGDPLLQLYAEAPKEAA